LTDIYLCEIEDLIDIGNINVDIIDSEIDLDQKIIDASAEILEIAEDDTLTRDNLFARKACVYAVKLDLEDDGFIKRRNPALTSFSDGDISVGLKGEDTERAVPETTGGKYEFYLAKIMALPVAGHHIDNPEDNLSSYARTRRTPYG